MADRYPTNAYMRPAGHGMKTRGTGHGFRRLARLAQAVTASLALGEVLESVAAAATDLVADSSVRIWVIEGGRLALRAEAGTHGPPAAGRKTALDFGEGLTGHVAAILAPLVVDDVLSDRRTVNVEWMRSEGFVSYMGLPLSVRDQLVGVLSLHARHRHRFTREEVEILTSFGAQAAIAINNARLFEETEERRRAAESLAQAARTLTESLDFSAVAERTVATVQPLFRARYSVLRLLRPDGALVVVASAGPASGYFEPGHVQPAGVGLAGRAVADARPAWSRDVLAEPGLALSADLCRRFRSAGLRAFLAAPLVARGKIVGVLAIGHNVERDFSDGEINLLGTFADQAALALENARLYQAAQAREAFIRNVIESLGEGLVVLDKDGRVVAWNHAVAKICGHTADEALGRPFPEVLAAVAPGLGESVGRLLTGTMAQFFLEAVECRRSRDGRAVLNFKGSGLIEGDQPSGAAILIEDITERVALARAVRQAEKMAALGTLSAGIAHEVNNPIGIITSRVELMLREAESHGLPAQVTEDLQVLHRNASRVARIVQGLLSLSRPSSRELGPLDLNRVVQDTLLLFEPQVAAQGIRMVVALDPALPLILGEANGLQQVVLNLLTNSREAMRGGGEIRIETRSASIARERVRLGVTDSGCGIPAENVPKIFDPFYTTKDHGTGLGLSVSYAIVREHQGTMDVQSEPGRGATFMLTFPALRLEDFARFDRAPR